MAVAETTERLEARLTADQTDLFKRAASLRGVTLTDFVVSSVHEAAVRTPAARPARSSTPGTAER
jgi:uncharacterized protein (DUF1778 family)